VSKENENILDNLKIVQIKTISLQRFIKAAHFQTQQINL